jgi:hypothetical protein
MRTDGNLPGSRQAREDRGDDVRPAVMAGTVRLRDRLAEAIPDHPGQLDHREPALRVRAQVALDHLLQLSPAAALGARAAQPDPAVGEVALHAPGS